MRAVAQQVGTDAEPLGIRRAPCLRVDPLVREDERLDESEKPIEGRSFATNVLKGTPGHRAYAVSGCHIRARDGQPPRKATTPFLVADRWGYTPVGAYGRCELYDLASDPLAATNVAADHPDQIADLYDLLLSHLVDHGAPADCCALWQDLEKEGSSGTWAIDYPDKTV